MEQRRPLLLVSVRDADEARAAIAGGADIIDVKEPRRGSLGMADVRVIHDILRAVAGECPVSAACGEVGDPLPGDAGAPILEGLTFAKMGLARTGANWREAWCKRREMIAARCAPATDWVAVAYADFKRAEAPAPADVLQAGIDTGCRGLLIDTYEKDEHGLLSFCAIDELNRLADRAHADGLFLALAGRLTLDDISRLRDVAADIIAVRGAACAADNRLTTIDPQRVRQLTDCLRTERFASQVDPIDRHSSQALR